MLHDIFKGEGSPSDCADFRDVMRMDSEGKNMAKYIRRNLLQRVQNIVLEMQFGGRLNGGGETAFAHLYIRCVKQAAVHAKTCCGLLFLAVVCAFASLLRRIEFFGIQRFR